MKTQPQTVAEGATFPPMAFAMIQPEAALAWQFFREPPEGVGAADYAEGVVGIIPTFVSGHDERPIAAQIDEAYQHGGGWSPLEGYTMSDDMSLGYEGDPPRELLAACLVNEDEMLLVYSSAVCAIARRTGEFEVSRLD